MAEWKKNLIVTWISQFLVMAGFWFVMPFVPYYIQYLGADDKTEINFWVVTFSWAGLIGIAVFSPLWGKLADRYGRKLMLLRAYFCNAMVIPLMGFAPNIGVLVLLRLLMGVFSGSAGASQTLISSCAPHDKRGRALGLLSSAVYAGSMAGSFMGGTFVDAFGYRAAFIFCGCLYLVSALLVLFCVTEKPNGPAVLPASTESGAVKCSFKIFRGPMKFASMIMFLSFFMGLSRQLDAPFLPLLTQEIHGSIDGAATWTGIISGVGALAGLLAGPLIGMFTDRISIPKIAIISAIGAGVFMLPQGMAHGMSTLIAARFVMIFFAGGLDPVFQIWLAKSTPDEMRGVIFGWAFTSKCIGWMLAAGLGGLIATFVGLRWIYAAGCLLFILHVPLIRYSARLLTAQAEEADGQAEAAV